MEFLIAIAVMFFVLGMMVGVILGHEAPHRFDEPTEHGGRPL